MSLNDFPHKTLLFKYLKLIHEMEGHDFLEKDNPNTIFNDDEYKAIKKISDHVDRIVYECSLCEDYVDAYEEERINKDDWPCAVLTGSRLCQSCKVTSTRPPLALWATQISDIIAIQSKMTPKGALLTLLIDRLHELFDDIQRYRANQK